MPLNLKRGPKQSVWIEAVITHRDDMGKTYDDRFEVLVRTPTHVDDVRAEAGAMNDALGVAAGTGGQREGDAIAERDAAGERVNRYLRENVLDWRKVIGADDQPIPFSAEALDEMIMIPPYRGGLVRLVLETRYAPAKAERKN